MIEKRYFGQTKHKSSVVIFGAAALWNASQSTANKVLDLLFQYEVNHIDVAPRYGDAEIRVGDWMRSNRKHFFLATKTAARGYAAAKEELYYSLDRLQTDCIDLIQLHSLTHPDEWDQTFDSDGALSALVEARDKGLVRFIGVTGHGWNAPAMHWRSLQRYDFDSILMPWNWFAANYKNYQVEFDRTASICKNRNVAIQTIKAVARGPWAAKAEKNRTTWYQPYEGIDAITKNVRWVLGRQDVFLNSVGDVELLPLVLRAASSMEQVPTDSEMRTLEKTEGMASIFGI